MDTRAKILAITRQQLEDEGLPHLTIQGVADELGVTKQAVLYWFKSKNALLREIFFDAIEAESDVLVAAVERAANSAEAIENFLRDGYAYHRANIPQFRVTYLLGQMERSASDLIPREMAETRLYPVTSRYYDALERVFRADPDFPDDVDPRNFAVSLHLSLLGHVMMRGTLDAIDDEFRQPFEALLDASIGMLKPS